jgi:O-antigen/teichoic acid export membrane protein
MDGSAARMSASHPLPASAPPFDDTVETEAPSSANDDWIESTARADANAAPTARKTAARNFAWMMLDKSLALFFGLGVFGLIARGFGSTASGHFAYALALLQSALGLSLVCSAAAILPRLCRMKNGVAATLANVFIVRLVGSSLAAAAAAVFALIVISDPVRLKIALIILISVPLIEPFYTAVVYWQSRNDNRRPMLCRAAGLLTRAAVVLLALYLGAPLWIVAFAWVLEACVSAVLLYSTLRPLATLRVFMQRVSAQRSLTYMRFGIRFLAGMWLGSLFLRLDRLVLGELLPAAEFGIYASAMQLVDVWMQIAYLTGFAVGPAFLYKALAAASVPWQLWRVTAMLAGIGCIGLIGALLLGEFAMALVFGPKYTAGAPYLVAGTATGVLLFADLVVQMNITAGDQPFTLTVKWAAACIGAVVVMASTYRALGAFAGATGLSAGVVCGWIAVWVATRSRAREPRLKRASA